MNAFKSIACQWSLLFPQIIKNKYEISIKQEDIDIFKEKKSLPYNLMYFLLYDLYSTNKKINKKTINNTLITSDEFLNILKLKENNKNLPLYFSNKTLLDKKYIFVIMKSEDSYSLFYVENIKLLLSDSDLKIEKLPPGTKGPKIFFYATDKETKSSKTSLDNFIAQLENFYGKFFSFVKVNPSSNVFNTSSPTIITKNRNLFNSNDRLLKDSNSISFQSGMFILNLIKEALTSRSVEGYIKASILTETEEDDINFINNIFYEEIQNKIDGYIQESKAESNEEIRLDSPNETMQIQNESKNSDITPNKITMNLTNSESSNNTQISIAESDNKKPIERKSEYKPIREITIFNDLNFQKEIDYYNMNVTYRKSAILKSNKNVFHKKKEQKNLNKIPIAYKKKKLNKRLSAKNLPPFPQNSKKKNDVVDDGCYSKIIFNNNILKGNKGNVYKERTEDLYYTNIERVNNNRNRKGKGNNDKKKKKRSKSSSDIEKMIGEIEEMEKNKNNEEDDELCHNCVCNIM